MASSVDKGFRLVEIQGASDAMLEEKYKDDPNWNAAMRSNACRALAEMVARDYSIFSRTSPPKERPFDPVIYRWTIGVMTRMDEVQARMDDVEAARRRGLHEAALLLEKESKRVMFINPQASGILAEIARMLYRK